MPNKSEVILVVDDSALSRRFSSNPLREAGFEVIEADNGQAALAAVQSHNVDCIVTDLLMPVMDGFALLESLQSVGHTVPVIVVSADIQQSSRDRCKELGCQTFLNKPFKSPALIEAVECALAHMQTKVLS